MYSATPSRRNGPRHDLRVADPEIDVPPIAPDVSGLGACRLRAPGPHLDIEPWVDIEVAEQRLRVPVSDDEEQRGVGARQPGADVLEIERRRGEPGRGA